MQVVEVRREEFRQMVRDDAQWDPVAGGFRFTEGPTWVAPEGALYFSDIPADTVYRWTEASGAVDIRRRSSRKTNGMTRHPAGGLIMCEQVSRRVVWARPDGSYRVLADHFGGARLNSPNDVTVHADGSIWFSDPPYGLASIEGGYPGESELGFNGVYRIDPDSGEVSLMTRDLAGPNGLAFNPSGTVLYVSDSERSHLRRFAIVGGDPVHLEDQGVFAVLSPDVGEGVPDGLRVTASGHLFATGPGGVWAFNADGTWIGLLRNLEVVANCELGGPQRQSLFVTATSTLGRIDLRHPMI